MEEEIWQMDERRVLLIDESQTEIFVQTCSSAMWVSRGKKKIGKYLTIAHACHTLVMANLLIFVHFPSSTRSSSPSPICKYLMMEYHLLSLILSSTSI